MPIIMGHTGLGISVYPRPGDEGHRRRIEDYVHAACGLGYNMVFTSVHLPEDELAGVVASLGWLAELTARNGARLILDLTSREMRFMSASEGGTLSKALRETETLLRLDYDFGDDDIVAACDQVGPRGLILNASVLTWHDAVRILNLISGRHPGMIVEACHNFYPRPETGLSMDFMIEKSRPYADMGIPVAACIASHREPRGPLHQGLPTVESHRSLSPELAAAELVACGVINQVFFGDPFASIEELEGVRRIARLPALRLRVALDPEATEVERDIVLGQVHHSRPDRGAFAIRSQSSREMAKQGTKIPARQAAPRMRCSVTIDNERYARYSGELQIVTTDLPPDERVNVVGRVIPEDEELLRYVSPGSDFILEESSPCSQRPVTARN